MMKTVHLLVPHKAETADGLKDLHVCNIIPIQITISQTKQTFFNGTLKTMNLVPGITDPRGWYASHLKENSDYYS